MIHRDITSKYEDEFFANIIDVVKSKGRNNAESYFLILKPTANVSDQLIGKYQSLLDKTLAEDKDNTFLLKMIKDTLSSLKTMKRGHEVSLKEM